MKTLYPVGNCGKCSLLLTHKEKATSPDEKGQYIILCVCPRCGQVNKYQEIKALYQKTRYPKAGEEAPKSDPQIKWVEKPASPKEPPTATSHPDLDNIIRGKSTRIGHG